MYLVLAGRSTFCAGSSFITSMTDHMRDGREAEGRTFTYVGHRVFRAEPITVLNASLYDIKAPYLLGVRGATRNRIVLGNDSQRSLHSLPSVLPAWAPDSTVSVSRLFVVPPP